VKMHLDSERQGEEDAEKIATEIDADDLSL
jgi:hypothetical protein